MRMSMLGISFIGVITLTVLFSPATTFSSILVSETAAGGRDDPENPTTGWREIEDYYAWESSAEAYAWDGSTWASIYADAETPTCRVRKYAVCEDPLDTLNWAYHGSACATIAGHAMQDPDNPATNAVAGADANASITGSASSGGGYQSETASVGLIAEEDGTPPAWFHASDGYEYPYKEVEGSGTTGAQGAFVEVEHSCEASAWILYDAPDASAEATASVTTCSLTY